MSALRNSHWWCSFVVLLPWLVLLLAAYTAVLDVVTLESGLLLDRRSDSDDQPKTDCAPDFLCEPRGGEIWQLSKKYWISWNSKYPAFVVVGSINIKLVDIDNPQKPLKEFNNFPLNQEFVAIYVTKDLFPEPGNQPLDAVIGKPLNRTVQVYISGSGDADAPSKMVKSGMFTLQGPEAVDPNAITAATTATAASPTSAPVGSPVPPRKKEKSTGKGANGLSPPLVGVLTGISVGALVALIVLVIVCRRYYKKRRIIVASFSREHLTRGGSIYSMEMLKDADKKGSITPGGVVVTRERQRYWPFYNLLRNRSTASSTSLEQPFATEGHHNQTSESPTMEGDAQSGQPNRQRFTNNDAMMVAQTFRSLLQKPSWEAAGGEDGEVERETGPGADGRDIEEWRRRHGEQLLRDQLAEEGTGIKNVQTGMISASVLRSAPSSPSPLSPDSCSIAAASPASPALSSSY